MLENKYLRWHYIVAATVFTMLITGFMIFKGRSEGLYPEALLVKLKMISYTATFIGIPLAYGWFKKFVKVKPVDEPKKTIEQEAKDWKNRFIVFSVLTLLNTALYISTFDRSLMFVLIICLMVYLLNKPKLEENKTDE